MTAPAPGLAAWAEWYEADGSSRTLAQDLDESKHDAMRRAFLAGTVAAQRQPASRPLDGLVPVGLYFDDGRPVARCLVGACASLVYADSVTDALTEWAEHLAKDHRRDWPEAGERRD